MKWLEGLFEKIKKNKGLMFTLLSLISVTGIFASLYFVSYLVEDVARKTFKNQQKEYAKELKVHLDQEKDLVLAIASTSSLDTKLIELFSKENKTATQTIQNDQNTTKIKEQNQTKPIQNITYNQIANKYKSNIQKYLDRKDIKIKFFKFKNTDENVINGVIVKNTGTYFIAKMPFAKKEKEYLNVEVISDFYKLKETYNDEDKRFIYLISQSSINKLDRTVFKKLYKRITNEYAININKYSPEIIPNLKKIDFEKLLQDGYFKDKDTYYCGVKIYDIEGNEIGLALISEKISKNSIVNLVKKLVNNVTMIALGLIVSMILFLF